MSTQTQRALSRLLDRAQGFGPEYGNGLSSHLPMTLIALDRLGASAQRLEDFYASYVPRLIALPEADAPIDASCDSSAVVSGIYRDQLIDLRRACRATDIALVVGTTLERLQAGVGAAAFHGLLRFSYGIDAKRADETLAGLAYWSARFLPLSATLPEPGSLALLPWLERIAKAYRGIELSGDLIHQKMSSAAALPEFQRLMEGLGSASLTPLDFARLAARHYAVTKDFTVLHLVTSAHAIQRAAVFAGDSKKLLRWYAVAYGAVIAVVGLKLEPGQPTHSPTLDWAEIRRLAIISADEHVIKICYTLSDLYRLDPDPAFQHAASCAAQDPLETKH